MPPPAETLFAGDYSAHKAVFDRLCGQPSGGVIVQGAGPSDVPSTLGPVRILDMYTCGGKIGVIGMVPTAEVRLFRGLTLVASKVPRGELAEFDLSELGPGGMSGTWTAFQRIGSVTSPPSLSVMARNIAADFPGALPAPLLAVSPATHACAQSVAVGHVPGATLEVRRIRAGVPTTRLNGGSSRGSTGALADAAFNTQDSISVRQQCGTGPWSGWSTPGRMPRVEPLPLPQPGIDNNEVFVGQSFVVVTGLIAGARTELGPVSTSSWPIYQQWIDIGGPLGRPLVSTDALPLRQKLCASSTPDFIVRPRACGELPAPEVNLPLAGNRFVSVSEYVPGANIRVFAGAAEIGDGSGGEIILTRALIASETLTITQSLPGCPAGQHFQIGVR